MTSSSLPDEDEERAMLCALSCFFGGNPWRGSLPPDTVTFPPFGEGALDIWSLASSSSTLSSTSLNDRDPDPSPSSSAFLATLAPSVAFLSSSASLAASSSAAAASAMIAACAAASHAAAASASAPDVSRGVHNPLCSLASSSVAGALDRGDFLIPTRGEKPPLASTFSAMFSELLYCVCCEMPGDVGWDAG